MKVVELLLNRQLARVRYRPGIAGYLSVMVDPDEVKDLLYERTEGTLSLREVEQMLRSSTRVVAALIELGHLGASVVVHPVSRLKQRVVSEEELDRFTKRFVNLHSLAKESGVHFRKLANILDDRGIEPAFDPEAVQATFYERLVVADGVSRLDG
jgi:hypothetical protein